MDERNKQNQIGDRFVSIFDHIQNVCVEFGRETKSVKLIVVTKGHTSDDVQQVVLAGAKYVGENYPEETIQKKADLGNLANQTAWHMIGHIQSRKTKMVSSLFGCVHSIDRIKIAEKLNGQLLQEGLKLPVLLQYNVGGEEQKYGWQADEEKKWSNLLPDFEKILQLNQLEVVGLMTMPPFTTNKDEALRNFDKLGRLKEFLGSKTNYSGLKELSMGTSHDYEAAIQAGATYIRIGTAIMGDRSYKQ